jgi:excisionase family DNA binding protein
MKPTTCYRLPPERAAEIRTAPPAVMTVMEAAAYVACSPRKLRDLIQARKLKSTRVGSKIVIRREWLDAMLGA